jgi:hypothetical protein
VATYEEISAAPMGSLFCARQALQEAPLGIRVGQRQAPLEQIEMAAWTLPQGPAQGVWRGYRSAAWMGNKVRSWVRRISEI